MAHGLGGRGDLVHGLRPLRLGSVSSAPCDPRRGGKLAAFVLHMTTKTRLVYGSIEQYVWGVRVWMQSQMVVDRPSDGCALLGVVHASYQGAHLGAKRASARRPARDHRGHHRTIEAIIDLVEARYLHDLFAVQMVFLILVLYYSFSRTECPCPKTYTGRDSFDEMSIPLLPLKHPFYFAVYFMLFYFLMYSIYLRQGHRCIARSVDANEPYGKPPLAEHVAQQADLSPSKALHAGVPLHSRLQSA